MFQTYSPGGRELNPLTVPFQPSRLFQVNTERETFLNGPGVFRLTVPPLAFHDHLGTAIRGRMEVRVQVLETLSELFIHGLHTWAEGEWMGLHRAVLVKDKGDNLFLPPLTLDLREPSDKKVRSACRQYHWVAEGNSRGWSLRHPHPLASYRYLGEDYFRIAVTEPAWLGFLHPIAKASPSCMVTLRLDKPFPPEQIRVFVRLHERPCFGPVSFHRDRWGATGLPSGIPATFFACGQSEGHWYYGQQTVEPLRNQRLQIGMQSCEKTDIAAWVRQLLDGV